MRTFIIAFFLILSFAPVAFAQDTPPGGNVNSPPGGNVSPTIPQGSSGTNITLINPLKAGTDLQVLLDNILAFIIRIGTMVVILMLVFVGYKFVVAQGAPAKIEEAKKMLLWTIVGALVLLGAQAISLGIQATVKAISGT